MGRLVPGFGVVEVGWPVEVGLEQLVVFQIRGGGKMGVFLTDSGQVPGVIHVDIRLSHGDLDLVEPWLPAAGELSMQLCASDGSTIR